MAAGYKSLEAIRKTTQHHYLYSIGPFRLPVRNCFTIGTSVSSNSSTLPVQTTLPSCRKMMLQASNHSSECELYVGTLTVALNSP